ncbi:hypothetical protein AVEN_208088-1 [Araneus ventricosus]|uniref:Uncharacterized protein n=1 Tax=Araneus ventricosus TaxID=182803 RepID=A0A4Y2FZC8_ARAVE|nr:hypothetical protein AVEN_208088-1 [Araneus ventricosus]
MIGKSVRGIGWLPSSAEISSLTFAGVIAHFHEHPSLRTLSPFPPLLLKVASPEFRRRISSTYLPDTLDRNMENVLYELKTLPDLFNATGSETDFVLFTLSESSDDRLIQSLK